MLERFDIDDTAFRFFGVFDSGHLEFVCILFQQFVGHIGHFALSPCRLGAVLDAERDNHLVLPQRDGIDNRRLDFFRHGRIARLHESDLRSRLQGHRACQFQVMQFLFKTVALVGKVFGFLHILRQSRCLGLVLRLDELVGSYAFKFLFAGEYIHRQLFEINKVHVVHLVQYIHVLEKHDLMFFQFVRYCGDVGLHL